MSHKWRVVAFCFLAAAFTWGLLSHGRAGPPAVGAAIDRRGSRPVIASGAVLLALGVAAMGHVADLLGSYPPVLAIAAGFELAALATILVGFTRRRKHRLSHTPTVK